MSNKKIVYITGCLGFIGSYVTKACLDQGWYVKGIDKITYAARVDLLEEFNKNPRFNFEKLDICNTYWSFVYCCKLYIICTYFFLSIVICIYNNTSHNI